MTEGELRKIYYPVAESWKLIRKFSGATGTPVECFMLQEQAKMILENSGKTKFAEEVLSASINEIDRIMKENGGGYYEQI